MGKRATASGYNIVLDGVRHRSTFIDHSVSVLLTRGMPIYRLEFDWFVKSESESGKIEYCAICPIWPGSAVRVPTSPQKKLHHSTLWCIKFASSNHP